MIIGFALQSNPDEGKGDDVGANNFAAFCGPPHGARNKDIELLGNDQLMNGFCKNFPGNAMSWGTWTGDHFCPDGFAVCGIQTQIERSQGGNGDDTALNNVNIECCRIP